MKLLKASLVVEELIGAQPVICPEVSITDGLVVTEILIVLQCPLAILY